MWAWRVCPEPNVKSKSENKSRRKALATTFALDLTIGHVPQPETPKRPYHRGQQCGCQLKNPFHDHKLEICAPASQNKPHAWNGAWISMTHPFQS